MIRQQAKNPFDDPEVAEARNAFLADWYALPTIDREALFGCLFDRKKEYNGNLLYIVSMLYQKACIKGARFDIESLLNTTPNQALLDNKPSYSEQDKIELVQKYNGHNGIREVVGTDHQPAAQPMPDYLWKVVIPQMMFNKPEDFFQLFKAMPTSLYPQFLQQAK